MTKEYLELNKRALQDRLTKEVATICMIQVSTGVKPPKDITEFKQKALLICKELDSNIDRALILIKELASDCRDMKIRAFERAEMGPELTKLNIHLN